ncbi:MAG TPA: thiamine phosphate synthase [Candidatus Limosilactobacillus intestinigallinarum]|nr:thiamine phosphate synthase [Candidatus Limosilactobacillus intestinigallinarum]
MRFDPNMLRVYLVGGTQDVGNDPDRFLHDVEVALAAGVTAFQYREKDGSQLDHAATVKMATRLRDLTRHYRVPYFIDDDEELALQVGADGVHVGQKDQRIETVIRRAAGQLMIGYSCNTAAEIAKANRLAAVDYVGAGPVFPTTSKADADPALGLGELARLNIASQHPLVAIGGISQANLAATLKTGVAGVAVISMILGSHDIAGTVTGMRSAYHAKCELLGHQ